MPKLAGRIAASPVASGIRHTFPIGTWQHQKAVKPPRSPLPPVPCGRQTSWAHDPPCRFLPHLHITCAKRNTITTTSATAVSQSRSSSGDRHHHHHHPSSPHPESEVTNMITRRKAQQRGQRRTRFPSQAPAHPSVRTASVGPRLRLIATPGRRGRRLPNCAFIAHLAS